MQIWQKKRQSCYFNNKKIWMFLFVVSSFLIFFLLFFYQSPSVIPLYRYEHSKNVTCFYYKNGTNFLQELDDKEPRLGEDIFFHETSCPANISDVRLYPRIACSVESALVAHPNKNVFLLISSPVKVNISNIQNPIAKKLLEYPNFKIRHINFKRYVENTPLQKIYESKSLFTSKWPVSHASDVLRFASLYKFGGLYMDTDILVLRSLANMSNFASVDASPLHFGADIVGREMAAECADKLARTFNGSAWQHNGPDIIHWAIRKRCNVTNIIEANDKKCKGFHFYPKYFFAPVHFNSITKMMFQSRNWEKLKSLISKSYALHTYTSISFGYSIYRVDAPYLKLAKKYCPKIFKSGKLISKRFNRIL